jgi:hypothetical protein
MPAAEPMAALVKPAPSGSKLSATHVVCADAESAQTPAHIVINWSARFEVRFIKETLLSLFCVN